MNTPLSERRGEVGMMCLIAAEAAIFTIFVVAYVFYIGKSESGPQPRDVLQAPILLTICLLSSSVTVHAAVKALTQGRVGAFTGWWIATLALAVVFLAGTGVEWQHLIDRRGSDDQHEPVRHDVLLARRTARVSRDSSAS